MNIPGMIRNPFTSLARHFQLQPPPDTPYVLDTKVVPVTVLHTHFEDFPITNTGTGFATDLVLALPGSPRLPEGCYRIWWAFTVNHAVAFDNESFLDIRPFGSASSVTIITKFRPTLAGVHSQNGVVDVHVPDGFVLAGVLAGSGVGNQASYSIGVQRI